MFIKIFIIPYLSHPAISYGMHKLSSKCMFIVIYSFFIIIHTVVASNHGDILRVHIESSQSHFSEPNQCYEIPPPCCKFGSRSPVFPLDAKFGSYVSYQVYIEQGGRTWQPFVEGKNGHENFRQTHVYNFRDKCVIFARNRKFANLTQ